MPKFEVEIEDDICNTWDDEKYIPILFVEALLKIPYKNRDNYLCFEEERVRLEATMLDDLYEKMGKLVSEHTVRGEKKERDNGDNWESPKEHYTVEFSHISIEVAYYDEAKMRASKGFQEVGAVRERVRLKEAEDKAKLDEQNRLWRIEETERRDREEFERLNKKYKKSQS